MFLQKVWPKQITAKTPEMSRALFSFSCSMPDQLAVLIEAIKERLVPLAPGGHIHLGFDVTTLDAEGVDALMVALEALLPERRADWPYGAEEIVQALVDADLGAGARRSGLERRAAETR